MGELREGQSGVLSETESEYIWIVEGYEEFTITQVNRERCSFFENEVTLRLNGEKLTVDNDYPFPSWNWFTNEKDAIEWRRTMANERSFAILEAKQDADGVYHACRKAMGLEPPERVCDVCGDTEVLSESGMGAMGWVIANGQTFCRDCGERV